MTKLEQALYLATRAHGGQTDKSDAPYILHVIRVWQSVRRGGHDEAHQITALLHDVIEDTDVALEDIIAQFGDEIAQAVNAMTKQRGETYAAYLDRVAAHPIARIVKLSDSHDNASRISNLSDAETQQRLTKKDDAVFARLAPDQA